MPATADNTAYTLRANALALRDIVSLGRNVIYVGTLVTMIRKISQRLQGNYGY